MSGSDLMLWAKEADALQHVANKWTRSAFVPTTMQNKPEEILGAILAGRELGLSPMAALAGIDIIQGRPAMRANTMMGLVLGAGHEIWREEASARRVVVKGRRKGSNIVQETVWTIERATQAGLAGKGTWKAHPQAMLTARAEAEMCRLIAPDVLIGMPYTAEELAEEPSIADQVVQVHATVGEEQPDKPKTRRMKRAPLPPVEDEKPALPSGVRMGVAPLPTQPSAPAQESEDAEPTYGLMTPGQKARIQAAMRDMGLTTGPQQLDYLSRVLERTCTGADLDLEEAERVLEALGRELYGGDGRSEDET